MSLVRCKTRAQIQGKQDLRAFYWTREYVTRLKSKREGHYPHSFTLELFLEQAQIEYTNRIEKYLFSGV